MVHTAILYTGTVINGLLTHRPGCLDHVTPCTFVLTFVLWSASCSIVAAFTPTHKESFWVAYAFGFLAMEHLRWMTEPFGGDGLRLDGAVGLVTVTIVVVVSLCAVYRVSPSSTHDILYLLSVLFMFGMRLACGYHIHHAEWPVYAAFPLRHNTSGRAMGLLVGVMAQEIAGGSGYRLFCDGALSDLVNFISHLTQK